MTDKKKPREIRARLEQAAIDRRQQDEASMRSRGIYLSDNERADLQAIDDKYSPLLDAALQEEQAASATRPDVNTFYQGISPERNPDEWQAAQKRAAAAVRAWEETAPQEWKDAQARIDNLFSNRDREANGVYRAAYERQYKELGNDPAEITKRAKEQISRLVTDQYNHYKELSETAISMSAYDLVALGGKDWKLDAAETRKRITKALDSLHFRALGDNIQAIDEIKAYIDKAILDSPHIAPEGTPGANVSIIFKKRPTADGLITSVGGRQLSITDIDYQYALTPLHNPNAYISPLRDEIMQKLTFENGKLSILGSEPADLKKETKNGLQEIKNLDLPLLREIFTAVYKTAVYGDAHTVTIHIPSFCREMGIDVRRVPEQEEYKKAEDKADDEQAKPLKFNDVFAKMRQFENCIGISKGVYYELMRTIMIDPDRDLMTIAVPYMNHVLREIRDKNIVRDKEGKELYINNRFNWLMHTTIASERNKPAVEIVNRIITGLMQRGSIPDAKLKQNKNKKNIPPDRVTYKITYSGLIDNIPLLKKSLAEGSTASKNVRLARAFKKAFELLHTETDVYQYYVGLKIPEIVPNTSALADTLTITHEGENGNYKQRA